MISPVLPKNLFGLITHAVAVGHDLEPGLYLGEERQRGVKVSPIPQERDYLAHDVPCDAEGACVSGGFRRHRPRSAVVDVAGIETGIEKRRIAK